MEQHGRTCSSSPPSASIIYRRIIASLAWGHWDQTLSLGPARNHCQGELEAVLAGCGDKEIPAAPWGQVNCKEHHPASAALAQAPSPWEGVGTGRMWQWCCVNCPQGSPAQERGTCKSSWRVLWQYRWEKKRNLWKAIDLAWRTYQENVCFEGRLMMIGLNFSLRELLTKLEKVW